MEGRSTVDSVEPPDRYLAKLYRSTLEILPADYRAWALREWAAVVPHDGALWGSGSASKLRFHTHTVTGLPPEFPAVLEKTAGINPIVPRLLQNLDTPVDMRSVMADAAFFKSEIYRRAFAPYGITRILSTGHLDPRSGLYSLVTLYRKDRDQPFTPEEQARQKRITYHLFNAASHAFFLHLARDRNRPANCVAAAVDREGCFHEAQPSFLDLLDKRYPERQPYVLPFALPESGHATVIGDLCVSCQGHGDMFIVYLWPAGPLDRLTHREREIVFAVAQGLSFKQVARRIGVAPSTVANHLYRVYRKLGVFSRTELAALVYPPAQ